MTDIVRYNDTLDQPELLATSWKLAERICRTDFVPKSLRGNPEATLAALLQGRELGLGPMTALNHINVIEGRTSFSAQLQRAVALSAGHQIDVIETSPEKCVVVARRAGSEHSVTVVWTMADAKRAGLDQKSNWKKGPRQMLQARATAEAARLVAADATLGIPTTTEEATDGDLFTLDTDPGPAPPVERTVRRNGKAKAEPTPVAPAEDDGIVDAEVVDEPAPADPPSPAQKGKFFALCGEKGVSDDARHAIINDVTGGRVESWNDITKDEAGQLIDRLEEMDTPAVNETNGDAPWAGLDANDWLTWARSRSVKLVDFRPLGVTSYADLATGSDDLKAKAWALPDKLEEPF